MTIENNTINTGIAVGGVPGIDTQRMQTEVLVPDGGTTVMGGVLADTEGTTRQRTPGLASIPILGNLFKRKLITRQNSEILFFITPHIYRPDYQRSPDCRVPSVPDQRTIQISQPVPMGNPQTQHANPNAVAAATAAAISAARPRSAGAKCSTCNDPQCPSRFAGWPAPITTEKDACHV